MELRLADRRDAEAIREIYNREVLESTATFDLVPRSLEDQQAWLAARSGARAAIVAVGADGEVVGFGSLSPWRDRPAYATTVEDSVYVHRDHQGRGVGRALLAELVEVATAHGFHACMARIVGGHDASIALHVALRLRGRGHRARGGPKVRQVARRRADGAAPHVTVDDTFPRQHARTQRFTLGRAAQRHGAAGWDAGRVPALERARGPGHRAVGARPARRARSASWPIHGVCWPATPPTCPPEEQARRERAGRARRASPAYAD